MLLRSPVIVFACVLTAMTICVSSAPLLAQTNGAPDRSKMTLTQVIDLARSNYPAIQAAQAQQKAAQGAIGIARTAYLPHTDLLWQTNRATANNIYGLLLPQSVIPNISGPVIASDVSRSAWSCGGGCVGKLAAVRLRSSWGEGKRSSAQ